MTPPPAPPSVDADLAARDSVCDRRFARKLTPVRARPAISSVATGGTSCKPRSMSTGYAAPMWQGRHRHRMMPNADSQPIERLAALIPPPRRPPAETREAAIGLSGARMALVGRE